MEFLEGSRGIYRPIRVLFDTPIYDRALQLCWHIKSYKSQVALMMVLLSLQQEGQIPSWVTAEDMIKLILEKSKSTLRERLWEFELEGFDEDEATPLLTLLWAVNVSNKMRDVEFEARMLLKSPDAVPPHFQHHTVLNMAQDYAKILQDLEAPGSKLLCPQEVVIQVVPKVLQGFWVLPPRALLNMPSQLLSKLSIGVARATLDRVCDVLTTVGCQANFTRSTRDDMVLSILTEIRETWPHDILVNSIKSFSPVLLTEIADVTMRHICEMFQPRSPEVPALLTPEVETPAAISEEQQISNQEMNFAVVEDPLSYPAETAAKIQAREDGHAESSLGLDPKPSSEPDSAALTNLLSSPTELAAKNQAREDGSEEASLEMDNSTEPDTAAGVTPLLSPPAEPAAKDQAREDGTEGLCLETDNSTEPDTAAVVKSLSSPPAEPAAKNLTKEDGIEEASLEMDNSTEPDTAAVVTPLLSPPAEPAAEIPDGEDGNGRPSLEIDPSTELDTFAVVTPLLSQPVEPTVEVEAREDGSSNHSLEMEPKVTTTPDSVVVTPPAKPASKVRAKEELFEEHCQVKEPEPSIEPNKGVPLEPVVIVIKHSAVDTSMRGRMRCFLNWLRPLFCCFPQQNQTDFNNDYDVSMC